MRRCKVPLVAVPHAAINHAAVNHVAINHGCGGHSHRMVGNVPDVMAHVMMSPGLNCQGLPRCWQVGLACPGARDDAQRKQEHQENQ